MNETPKACPHCGAEQHPVLDDRYGCHTHILGDVGKPCLMYQLAAKDRELNAVRGELEDVKQALSDGDAARDRVRWDGDTNMAACRKERDELRAANAGLLEAFRPVLALYAEFLEGDTNYENAYLCFYKGEYAKWEKARAAIAKATT